MARSEAGTDLIAIFLLICELSLFQSSLDYSPQCFLLSLEVFLFRMLQRFSWFTFDNCSVSGQPKICEVLFRRVSFYSYIIGKISLRNDFLH